MLDVHPPHTPTHSWKDFFVHIATITVGLLIAVGIEQTVEWGHHLHQRHQLEAELREEGEKNIQVGENDILFLDMAMKRTSQRLSQVYAAVKPGQGVSAGTGSPVNQILFITPSSAVWTSAKSNSTAELLSLDLSRKLTRLTVQIELLQEDEVGTRIHNRDAEAIACRASHGVVPCVPDFSAMSPEQREAYATAIARTYTALREEKQRLQTYMALNEMILEGKSLDNPEVLQRLTEFYEKYPDPVLRP